MVFLNAAKVPVSQYPCVISNIVQGSFMVKVMPGIRPLFMRCIDFKWAIVEGGMGVRDAYLSCAIIALLLKCCGYETLLLSRW